MFDNLICDAKLPDGANPTGVDFQTKSFPDPCMQRFTITAAGRLRDRDGNDVEPDGYICFYGDVHTKSGKRSFREYRARFRSGKLAEIVAAKRSRTADRYYGLATFRWFRLRRTKTRAEQKRS